MTLFEALAKLGLALVAPARLSDGSAPTYHVQGEGGGVLCGLPWSEDDGCLTIAAQDAYDADLTLRVCAGCQKVFERKAVVEYDDMGLPDSVEMDVEAAENVIETFEDQPELGLQKVQAEPDSLITRIDSAYVTLRNARSDFERMWIRKEAHAVRAAAAILERRNIQAEASILFATAERAILEANPPRPEGRPKATEKTGFLESSFGSVLVKNIRAAHGKLTDEQFTAVAERARAQGEPLTRSALKREARKLNPPAQDDSDESEPDKPKPPTKAERLEAELDAARLDLQEKATRIDELEDELRFHRGNMDEQESERHKAYTALQAELSTARSQMNEWMVKYNEELRSRKYWEREAKRLGWAPSNGEKI